MSGYVKLKDQKVLWARAAGRCSIAECRVLLTLDIEARTATLGAMCHIVGEKQGAARWRDTLTDVERNAYSNLVLLCSHHHDIIDHDEPQYSIERLHTIKADHEEWVAESLTSGGQIDPDDSVYADLIDMIAQALYLDAWNWFIDNAVRDLLPEDVFEYRAQLNRRRIGALFPGRHPELDAAIRKVIDAYNEYVTHFEIRAEPRGSGPFFGPDKSYARVWDPEWYAVESEKENRWSMRGFWLLCDLVLRVNEFCDIVRRYINPMFFRVYGRFTIIDSLGYRFGGRNSIYLPTDQEVFEGLHEWPPDKD